MSRGSSPRPLDRFVLALVPLLLTAPATTVVASYAYTPMVLDLTGDEGDAWAVAIKSDDEPSSTRGNDLVVSVVLKGEPVRSVPSMGIFELTLDPDGEFRFRKGMIGSSFYGENRIHIHQVGGMHETPTPSKLTLTSLVADGDKIGAMGEIRAMEPGEWRYFVAWAAGSEESRFRLRGDGFEIRKLVRGEGITFGNSELVGEDGHYVRQGVYLPRQAATGDGYLGAGAAAATDTGVTLETQQPILGGFLTYHLRYACTGLGLSVCINTGNDLEAVASQAVDGGFSNTSLVTPEDGRVWQEDGDYWLMPNQEADDSYLGTTPGTYEFEVDQLINPVGPRYRDPVWAHGVRLDGSQLVVSVAEIDYTSLAEDVSS